MNITKVQQKMIINSLYDVIHEDFGLYDEEDYFNNGDDEYINDVIRNIYGSCWSYDYGVSKYVIIPEDEDYVIKIPMQGNWYPGDPVYKDDDDEVPSDYEEDYFEPWETDYCALEVDKYAEAEEAGYAKLFAETVPIGRTGCGCYIYAQEKANYAENKEVSEDSSSKGQKLSQRASIRISSEWLASVIEYYGESYATQFVKWLENNHVNDLHSGNCGYRENGEPVLIDYSGWFN